MRILFVPIVVLIAIIAGIGLTPQFHFWNTEEENHMTYCKWVKPMMNASHIDGGWASWCYTEGWSEYCKMSWPGDCPSK